MATITITVTADAYTGSSDGAAAAPQEDFPDESDQRSAEPDPFSENNADGNSGGQNSTRPGREEIEACEIAFVAVDCFDEQPRGDADTASGEGAEDASGPGNEGVAADAAPRENSSP